MEKENRRNVYLPSCHISPTWQTYLTSLFMGHSPPPPRRTSQKLIQTSHLTEPLQQAVLICHPPPPAKQTLHPGVPLRTNKTDSKDAKKVLVCTFFSSCFTQLLWRKTLQVVWIKHPTCFLCYIKRLRKNHLSVGPWATWAGGDRQPTAGLGTQWSFRSFPTQVIQCFASEYPLYKKTRATTTLLQLSFCQWVSLKISCKGNLFKKKKGGGEEETRWPEYIKTNKQKRENKPKKKKAFQDLCFGPEPRFESFLWPNNGVRSESGIQCPLITYLDGRLQWMAGRRPR